MIPELYYSQRQKQSRHVPQTQIGSDFCAAFFTYLNRLSEENYLCKTFPGACRDGHPTGKNDQMIASRMREELGEIEWPVVVVSESDRPDTEQMLDFIEFFFGHVAKPTQSWYHDYCNGSHPTEYDVKLGRYDYTVKINAMLKRFNHPYKLCNAPHFSSRH